MLPPQYYSQNSEDVLSAKPVGSGPFKFVESVRDDHTTLARNPNYWGVDTYKGTPLVATVTFRPVPDAGTRMADLLNGTADMIFDVSPDDLSTLRGRASDGFQVVTGNASAKLQFVEFLPKKATDPLADRRVRQALNHAVERRGDRHQPVQRSGNPPVEPHPDRCAGVRPERARVRLQPHLRQTTAGGRWLPEWLFHDDGPVLV